MQQRNNPAPVVLAFLAALGLPARIREPGATHEDALVSASAGGREYLLLPRATPKVTPQDIKAARRAAEDRTDLPVEVVPVLVIPSVSSTLRAQLDDDRMSWVDEHGSGRIRALPSLHLARDVVEAPGATDGRAADPRWTPSAGAVAEAVLAHAARPAAGWDGENDRSGEAARALPPLGSLADRTAVTTGQVSRVLAWFDTMGWTSKAGPSRGAGARRLVEDPAALLRAWTLWHNQRSSTTIAGHVLMKDATSYVTDRLVEAFEPGTWCATGQVASELLAPFATRVGAAVCYVDRDRLAHPWTQLLERAGARPVREGETLRLVAAEPHVLLQMHQRHGVPVANPVRVYADVLTSGVRGEELAANLRETVLGF